MRIQDLGPMERRSTGWIWLWLGGLLGLLFARGVQAAPALTTVQDVLYKADGSRFSGVAFVEWQTFQAADGSTIARNTLAVPIVDGNLRVQLVPTTNASSGARYTVRYNADGRTQFTETWAVAPSSTPLKLSDVRTVWGSTGGGGTSGGSSPVSGPIQISDVVGLQSELTARPVKSGAYAPSRAVFANAAGSLEAVTGNLSDCVRVDGTAGPCGSSAAAGPGFVDGETPAGLVNGSNDTFTLANTPSPLTSLKLFRNGVLQKQGLDYTVTGNSVVFATASRPQTGDVLQASYRLADSGNPAGSAGGHLTGTYPNPQIALGVISDANIAGAAGIREAKLALNYPTHSSANDPTAAEKAALAGTAGSPSGSNRYVTNQDARLTDSRTPSPHALLSSAHSDTTAAAVTRGDLLVGQGTSPATWSRLPIGPANRCLMSNGADAVWNTCLYTGFSAGSIPFVSSLGNLDQNPTRLYWDNSNRRLSLGNNTAAATLHVYDAAPAVGQTTVAVRAGQAQGTSPLQQWMEAGGTEVARVAADGSVVAANLTAATNGVRAAWRDTGYAGDPSARLDGDEWHHSGIKARRTMEGGQVHSVPQVICSSTGLATSATVLTRLGSCTIPAGLLQAGDRVEVQFSYAHEGTGLGFSVQVQWGATTWVSRAAAASETLVVGAGSAGIHAGGAAWQVQSWGTSLAGLLAAGNAGDSLASALTVDFLGAMSGTSSETVRLRNFLVVRYPAQTNP